MEETTPRDARPTTEDLEGYTTKEITVLPASVLGPIIRQGIIDSGANEPTEDDIKQAIDVVRRGHWVPGMPRNEDIKIHDLFEA